MLQIWNAYTEEHKQMGNMKSDLGVETKNERIWPKIQRLVELFCKIPELGKTSIKKKPFLSGIARIT